MPDWCFHSPMLPSGTLGDLYFAQVQEVESDGYAGGGSLRSPDSPSRPLTI